MNEQIRVALAGNPNSGKTTMFNALTGRNERVGNWAGVTIEKKEGAVKESLNKTDAQMTLVDLPGAYSMSPFTSEESITSEYIQQEKPDVIINIVDAANLSRSLFFTTQLLELHIPVVVALNKSDLVRRKKAEINVELLSRLLGCPVVETVSTKTSNNGLDKLISTVVAVKGKTQTVPFDSEGIDLSDEKSVKAFDKKRYEFVKDIVAKVEKRQISSNRQTRQDAVDRILAHKWLGILIFAVVMWVVFSISQTYLGPFLADIFVGWIDAFYAWVEGLLGEGTSPVLSAILLDGIIGGVGAVVGFLPLIMLLFFLLALLEDCGYMARVAVIMDRFFKKVGLSGKSIIPILVGIGCSTPGIMATRTIKDERQRKTTVMLTPFMPCGAKLPIIALFAGVFFNDAAWVGTLMYFIGIVLIIIGALFVARITGEKQKKSYFIIELPEYKIPSLKRAVFSMFSRAKGFIVKAGTIILLSNVVVQIMQTFNWRFEVVAEGAEHTSILATIASPFALLLIPLGFGTWQFAAASISGFIAKENVVGTLAVVYGITNFIDPEELVLISDGAGVAGVLGLTSVSALAYLMFNLYTPPCFAAIGAMNAEMEDRKWLWGAIAFQFCMGYIVAFITYQFGTLITTGSFGIGFVPGLVIVAAMVGWAVYLVKKGDKKAYKRLALSA